MSRQVVMPSSVPKPKVFRLPPAAASSQPITPPSAPRSGRAWRWSLALLTLALIWPVAQEQATVYFAHEWRKNPAESDDSLGSIIQPPVSDAQAASSEAPPTILLRGRSEAIVGQMAKISAENEPIIETKALSEVDNNAGRELLSIISKY